MRPDPLDEACTRGLALAERGEYFTAHETLEDAWRAASPAERDFFQGLVHVVVAWHHACVTGRSRACASQLDKATRRLEPFAPAHRKLDVAALLEDLNAARAAPFPLLPTLRFRRPETPD